MTTTQACFALPSEFWARFVDRQWEKCPFLLKQLFPTPLATPDDVLRGIVEACAAAERNRSDDVVQFFVEHARLEADIKRYLPRFADRSLEGYVKRASQALGGRQIGLVVRDYAAYDVRTWLRLREFLRPLYELIGLPGDSSQPVVLLGNYEKTPFGLHADVYGAFVFVIAGRKRFRMWPEDYIRCHPEARGCLDFLPFLNDAITLEGEPGDVLYWPSTYWHSADSREGVTASLTVPVLKGTWSSDDRHLRQQMLRAVEDRLEAADGIERRVFPMAMLRDYATTIPDVAKSTTRTLERVLREPGFEDELKVLWLNHVSSLGFSRVPPPLAHARLGSDAVIQGDPRFPILWLPGSDETLICSANGHCFSFNGHPKIPMLLKRLNSGEPCRVADLVREYAGLAESEGVAFDASPEDIRGLLEKRYSLRAISPADNLVAKRRVKRGPA